MNDEQNNEIGKIKSKDNRLKSFIERVERLEEKKYNILIKKKKLDDINQEKKIRIFKRAIKDFTKNYYAPRSKKVFNLIDGFQRNRIKKCTLGGCIFERKKRLIFISKEQ